MCVYIYIYIYINTDTYSHKNIIYLVIQVRLCFSTLYLKVFKLFALSIESGKLFQIEGPIYEIAFCPMLVLQKGFLSLEKLFLVPMLPYGTNAKISFR